MKIRIFQPVLLGPDKAGKPGDVVELNERAAFNIISLGRGEEFKEPAAKGPGGAGEGAQERDPEPETREGGRGKGGRGKGGE